MQCFVSVRQQLELCIGATALGPIQTDGDFRPVYLDDVFDKPKSKSQNLKLSVCKQNLILGVSLIPWMHFSTRIGGCCFMCGSF